jgi:hypothetical protein
VSGEQTDWLEVGSYVATILTLVLYVLGWPGLGELQRRGRVSGRLMGAGMVALVAIAVGGVWLWGWSEAWPVVLGGVAGACVLAYRWRDRWRGGLRRAYVGTVVWLARRVRSDVAGALRAEAARGVPEEIAERVRTLRRLRGVVGRDSLVLLVWVLGMSRTQGPAELCEVRVEDLPFHGGGLELAATGADRLLVACQVLKRWDFLSYYERSPLGSWVMVRLAREIQEVDREGALYWLASEELERLGG